jgi:two-component system response regulator
MQNFDPVEILIVEDNTSDVELTVRALKKNNLANKMYVVKDGREALDFLFCKGQFESCNPLSHLKVIFLDLKLPKIDGLDVLKEIKSL